MSSSITSTSRPDPLPFPLHPDVHYEILDLILKLNHSLDIRIRAPQVIAKVLEEAEVRHQETGDINPHSNILAQRAQLGGRGLNHVPDSG